MSKDTYQRSCVVLDVHDGDTFRAMIDLGFETHVKKYVRLAKCNAPEISSKDPNKFARAVKAREALIALCPVGVQVNILSYGKDDYGRYICDVFVPDLTAKGLTVTQYLLQQGLVDPYAGGKVDRT